MEVASLFIAQNSSIPFSMAFVYSQGALLWPGSVLTSALRSADPL